MTPRLNIVERATLVAAVGEAALSLLIATRGPTGPVPAHFDMNGQVDRWGDRSEMALVVLGIALVGAVLAGGIALAARRAEADDARKARQLRMAQWVLVLAVAGVSILIGVQTLAGAGAAPPAGLHMAGLSLLFAVIGAFLGRVGPNPLVGVRTPWSYKSRLAWERSNRLAGRLLFLIGLGGLAGAAFAPQPLGMTVLICAVVIAAGLSVVESWRVWRDDPERQPF